MTDVFERHPCDKCVDKPCGNRQTCKRWDEWASQSWNEVCEPFRKMKSKRDKEVVQTCLNVTWNTELKQ